MYSLNRAQVIGNLTRDPEVRTTPTGQTVASFGVATNRSWTDAQGQKKEEVEFHNIVAWGKLAGICQQYLARGRRVYVEGRIRTREWQGNDGVKRNRTEIIVENMIMLDRPPQGGAPIAAPAATLPVSEPAPVAVPMADEEIKLEDIPF